MLCAYLSAHPWDLVAEDLGAVLDRLRGELGVTGVSVWAASPPVVQLRVRDVRPRVFQTRGGLLFPPDGSHYAATRCKPLVCGWVKSGNPIDRIAGACRERGLELRATVSASLTGRLAQHHREMACKNVYGDRSLLSVCLTNPDVRTYLCGLVSDLSSNYDVSAVMVTAFVNTWSEAFRPDLWAGAPLAESARWLLSTCFCESCLQRASAAGVDVESTRRSVAVGLQRSLENETPGARPLEAILADNEPLTAYCAWRRDALASLLRRLAESCRCELLVDRCLDALQVEQHAGLDWSIPAGVMTRIDGAEALPAAFCSAARRSEVRLASAHGPKGPELVGTLAQAVQHGIRGAEIETYGLLSEAALTSIRQAIRFARRSTSE